MNIIKSINDDQTALLRDIITLHCHGKIDADVTYGAGALWRQMREPQLKFDIAPREPRFRPTLRFDIKTGRPGVIPADCRNLPLKDKSLKSIMLDPPFISGSAATRKSTPLIVKKGYGIFPDPEIMYKFFAAAMRECFRVLRPRGVLIFKCQDYVHNHINEWSHVEIFNSAREIGFQAKDLFIFCAKTRPTRENMVKQRHARKFHTYFWVFRKPQKPRTKK